MSLSTWRALSARDRALVAVAVLVDGSESKQLLGHDVGHGRELQRAADELCALEVDLRVAFVGTALRLALEEE